MNLTNAMRDHAVEAATKKAFGKREDAHDAARRKLGAAIYRNEYGAAGKVAAKLPRGWVSHASELKIRHPDFERHDSYSVKLEGLKEDSKISIGASQPVPHYNPEIKIGEDHAMFEACCELSEQGYKLRKEKAEFQSKVRALLRSCNTVKQLTERWPEGVKLLPAPKNPPPSKALVPASLAAEVNRIMGATK